MERKRMLSWTQTQEAVKEMVEGFNQEEAGSPADSQPFDSPEPLSFRRNGSTYSIRYSWKRRNPSAMQIESMHFSDQNLRYLHQIAARDGSDSAAFTHSGFTYIARRTTLRLARRLLSAAGKLGECVSSIVAYFRTLAGNIYVLSRLDKPAWSLDGSICGPHLQSASWEDLGPAHKSRFAELATEMMVRLHGSRHIFSNPVPSEVMLDSKKAFVADPRSIRPMRRAHEATDNFILMMRGLLTRGFSCNGTLFYCLSMYVNSMEAECRAWYRKNKGSSPRDLFQVARELESRMVA